MPLARRLRLKMATASGRAVYAERAGGCWVLSLPGGRPVVRVDGDVRDAAAAMRAQAEAFGGAGPMFAA